MLVQEREAACPDESDDEANWWRDQNPVLVEEAYRIASRLVESRHAAIAKLRAELNRRGDSEQQTGESPSDHCECARGNSGKLVVG